MNNIGFSGFVLIVILALILFGPKKLPELGRAVGHTLREFKNATQGLAKDDDDDDKAKPQPAQAAVVAEPEAIDREKLEREIRERLERERLEQEIRAKLEQELRQKEQERLGTEQAKTEQDKPQA